MIKFKRILNTLAAVILVGLIAVVAVFTLVDPNEFKDFIEKQAVTHTGRILTIKGPIQWHLDPTLSLEIYDISVSNTATDSDTFLILKKAIVKPKFWSLLSGKLLVNLQLQGLDVHLNRNLIGQAANWEDLQKKLLEKKFNPRNYSLFFIPYNLTIEEGTLTWNDPRTNQNLQIKDLTLSAKKLPLGFSGFLVPVRSSFHFEDLTLSHSGKFSFNSEWCFDDKLQKFDIQDLEFTAEIQDLPTTTIMGELHIQQFKNFPLIEGTIQTINLGLQPWLSLFNLPHHPIMPKIIDLKSTFKYRAPFLDVASFTLSLDTGGTLEGSFKANTEGKALKTVTLSGAFQGKALRVGKFPITEIKGSLEAKEGVYRFDQIQAQFMNSQHQGKLQIDVRNPIPQFSLSDQMDSFNINELLTFFGEKDTLNGSAQVKATLNTYGTTAEECLHNLSGQAHVSLMDGNLHGIALSSLLQHAQSTVTRLADTLLKKQPINIAAILTAELGEWKQQAINNFQKLTTPFQLVETDMTIDRGKINTSEFALTHSEYTIHGRGSIDLIHKSVEYQASALLNHVVPVINAPQSMNAFLKETPLSILIKGPINNLSVDPELAHYADAAIKFAQKEPVENSKDNSLEKLFGFP